MLTDGTSKYRIYSAYTYCVICKQQDTCVEYCESIIKLLEFNYKHTINYKEMTYENKT